MALEEFAVLCSLFLTILAIIGAIIAVGRYFWRLHNRIKDIEREMKYYKSFEETMALLYKEKGGKK